MPGPSIQCQQLGLELGGVEILSAIDLSIAASEIHCVIGPNGGGKTSFVRSLLGQMPHSGNVEISWAPLEAPGSITTSQQTIGYVPQFLDFDKSLPISVDDFMAMICNQLRPAFAGFGRGKRELTEQALERVGLHGKSKTLAM